MSSLPQGRDRRRTDLYGRVRRLLYGVMLLVTANARAESDGNSIAAEHNNTTPGPGSAPELQLRWTQTAYEVADSWRAQAPTLPGGVALAGQAPGGVWGLSEHQPELHRLFSFSVSDDLRAIRDGVGLDLALPDRGNLHLNLHARKNAASGGKRFALGEEGEDGPVKSERAWSFGGGLDVIKVRNMERNTSSRRLDFAPQLMLDVSKMARVPGQMDAAVQYGLWRTSGNYAISDDRVLQMSVKWKF